MNANRTDADDVSDLPAQVVSARERGVVVAVLLLIAVLIAIDVATDLHQGASLWHVVVETVAGVQADAWQAQARKQVEGLARSIDRQLDHWKLSAAEKEIAFLLLKGLSLKAIADLRGTGEKTVRAQSAAIYAKAGLAGRSELSAFFLEDLLVPTVTATRAG